MLFYCAFFFKLFYQEALDNGEDYEKVKMLETQADDADRLEQRKKRKKNTDKGFADFAQASYRQYQRLTKQMKPSPEEYAREKDKM